MALDNRWFSEVFEQCGSAFSLRLKSKLHEEQSAYQKIEIYDTEGFGNLMVIDGCVMLTDRDNFIYHEMMAHTGLFSHLTPARVVIVGGGDCGTLREVLKHPEVKTVWQVEIDERVTRLAEQYFPRLCDSNDDPRAHFYFGDGIDWIKRCEPASQDIIIIDSTDPVGPAKGLFSENFYRDCHKALATGGLLVQQSESPLVHTESIIRPMAEGLRAAGFTDVAVHHFPQCSYPTGWWSAIMARKDGAIDFARAQAAAEKAFETHYYNAEIHRASTAAPEFFRRALAIGGEANKGI
ncbi:MAG: polyamine aminopropyltransferase [Gammaproteobacteria bacterium]|nr:polyamine aminopropyltransferase [Gammaproteobacteria bacterium]